MSKKLVTVKEVVLKNNCPECYSNEGLRLAFKQKVIDTKLYRSMTSKMSHEIFCKVCGTTIYPVKWTDDIERVFEYQKRAFTPKKASTYFKKPMWVAIGLFAVIAIIIAIMYFNYNAIE